MDSEIQGFGGILFNEYFKQIVDGEMTSREVIRHFRKRAEEQRLYNSNRSSIDVAAFGEARSQIQRAKRRGDL